MALTLEVQIPQLPLWVPAQAAQELYQLVHDTVHLILTDLAGRISQRAPVGVSGHLAQSFLADPAVANGGVELIGGPTPELHLDGRVFSALPYAIVIDQGREPGHPINREGMDAIGLWVQRKFGLDEQTANRVRWAVAYKIIQRGITARHFIEAAFVEGQAQWQQMLDELAQEIADALVRPVSSGPTRDSRGRFVKRA